MKKSVPILDTNLIIRFLAQDNLIQAKKVENLLSKAGKNSLHVPDIVFAEIIYVLLSVYDQPKKDVVEKMGGLVNFSKIQCNKGLLKLSLHFFANNNISFVDAYLLALVKTGKNSFLYSFDKRLKSSKQARVKQP